MARTEARTAHGPVGGDGARVPHIPAHPCPAAPADVATGLGALGPPVGVCGPGRETWTVSAPPTPLHRAGRRLQDSRTCGRALAPTVRAPAGTLLHAVGAHPGCSQWGPGRPRRCAGQVALPHSGWASQARCGVSIPRGHPGCRAFLLFLGTLDPVPSISDPSIHLAVGAAGLGAVSPRTVGASSPSSRCQGDRRGGLALELQLPGPTAPASCPVPVGHEHSQVPLSR